MCGIAGFLGLPEPADRMRAKLRPMLDAVAHRGPDDCGVWIDPDRGVGLGHHRLSVIDLSARGRQPMHSPGGRHVVSYNGEIYNYQEIGIELEDSGIRMESRTDTEVLLGAVEHWGLEQALGKLIGMFGFALWDRKEKRLHLVRDRLGIKPVYYARVKGAFLFASELSAILALPEFPRVINREAVTLYLRYGSVPAPHSVFLDCWKLEPGTILTIEGEDPSTWARKTYWSGKAVAKSGVSSPFQGTEEEAVETLDDLLSDAVQRRLLSDVPLGAFLSGGIDSSTVVALMQKMSRIPVKTFCIGNEGTGHNEAEDARRVAEYLGCDHTEMHVSEAAVLEGVHALPRVYSEPFGDSSQLPTWLVSRLARNQVTVALSGDGGDELFGGYNRHVWGPRIWDRISPIPLVVRRPLSRAIDLLSQESLDKVLASLGGWLPSGQRMRLPGEKARKFAAVLGTESAGRLYRELLYHWKDPSRAVIGGVEGGDVELGPPFRGGGLEHMMLEDLLGYLPDDVLVKVDRASMYFALEVRVPLLDHRVVEFAWTLPREMKVRRGKGKWILRRVLDRYLPSELVDRPKTGFSVPVASWLRGPLRDWGESMIGREKLKQVGVFDPDTVVGRWEEHLSGRRDWHESLWDVIMFQAWHDAWAGPATTSPIPPINRDGCGSPTTTDTHPRTR